MVRKKKETLNSRWLEQKNMNRECEREKLIDKRTYKKNLEKIYSTPKKNFQKLKEIKLRKKKNIKIWINNTKQNSKKILPLWINLRTRRLA